jgi:hypothetical protein
VRQQPASHPVIETVRGPRRAIAWCGGILLVSIAVSGVQFRRRTA